MELRVVQASRRPVLPGWAVAVLATWAALAGAGFVLGAVAGRQVSVCPLRNATGVPCPGCGSTRCAVSLLQGRVTEALGHNPLTLAAGAALAAAALARLALGRRLSVRLTGAERIAGWVVLTTLVLANWAYLILRGT